MQHEIYVKWVGQRYTIRQNSYPHLSFIEGKHKKTESEFLAELRNKIKKAYFPTFQTRVAIAKTEVNRVDQFLEVGMKTKGIDSQFGLLDAVRIVFYDKFHFKMYIIFMEFLKSLRDVCFEPHLFFKNSNTVDNRLQHDFLSYTWELHALTLHFFSWAPASTYA